MLYDVGSPEETITTSARMVLEESNNTLGLGSLFLMGIGIILLIIFIWLEIEDRKRDTQLNQQEVQNGCGIVHKATGRISQS